MVDTLMSEQKFTTIMGIDPGLAVTGYGVLRSDGRKHQLIDAHYLKTNAKQSHFDRLHYIFIEINALLERYQPTEIAIENQFVSQNVKSAISVAEARTVAVLAASINKINIFSYAPTEIKESVTGYGRADKQQVYDMVAMLVDLNEANLKYDTTDAIAIALTRISEWRYIDA
jgi:crossover junction endodeoxyribonuclease RuvC